MEITERDTTKRIIYHCIRKACKAAKTVDHKVHIVETRTAGAYYPQVHKYYDGMHSYPIAPACPKCGGRMLGKPIKGTLSANHKCDSRCTNARGSDCECSCGGKNHGAAWL